MTIWCKNLLHSKLRYQNTNQNIKQIQFIKILLNYFFNLSIWMPWDIYRTQNVLAKLRPFE